MSNIYEKVQLFYKLASMSVDSAMNVLGLSAGFSMENLNKAYKTLIKKYHPDINPEGLEKSKEINFAYSLLKEYLLENKDNTNIEEIYGKPSYYDRTDKFDQLVKNMVFGSGVNIGDFQLFPKKLERNEEGLPVASIEVVSVKRLLETKDIGSFDIVEEYNFPSYISQYFLPKSSITKILDFNEIKALIKYFFDITNSNIEDYDHGNNN